MATSQQLTVLISLCNSGMCPALYLDSTGKVFVQGTKLSSESRDELTVPGHEEIVEITPEILAFIKAQ